MAARSRTGSSKGPKEKGRSSAKKELVQTGSSNTLPVVSKREIVSLDPLAIYLQQVSRYPLLSREEELNLVDRLRKENDLEAAKVLVQSNLRLVVKIAMDYRTAYHNVLDLIQEGNIGLMKAVSMYDPEKGARLSYYASWWIKSYMLKFILDNFRLVKMGTTQDQRKLFYNLMREKERIEALGHYAGPKLLSERLGVSEKAVVEMDRRLSEGELSLDAHVSAHDTSSDRVLDFIAGAAADRPDVRVAEAEEENMLLRVLKEFSKELEPRDLAIFRDRLMAEIPQTLDELGKRYSISKERARQLEAKIMKRLKTYFEERGLAPEERRS